jgi:hypothetical protein
MDIGIKDQSPNTSTDTTLGVELCASSIAETKHFLDAILPDVGLRCIAEPSGAGGFRHSFFASNEEAAHEVRHRDYRGGTVYFACASYQTAESRKRENVAAARSFWADLDCGEGKPYRTAAEAAKGLLNFQHLTSLPTPFVVASGRGLHVYWPQDRDMAPEEWRSIAALLKPAMEIASLHADHGRTCDMASVLRPVGSHHRKDTPRLVSLKKVGFAWSPDEFRDQLQAFLNANRAVVAPSHTGRLNSDFGGGLGGGWWDRLPPDKKDEALREMLSGPRIRALADTSETSPAPNWLTVLAAAARSGAPSAREITREWAKSSSRYDDSFDARFSSFGGRNA